MPRGVYVHSARTWTAEHIAILREHAGRSTAPVIAALVGHSRFAVIKKMEVLGFKGCKAGAPRRVTWTPEQLAALRELAGTIPAREIADRLGHTKFSVQKKAHDLGLPGFKEGGRPLPPGERSRGTLEQQEQLRELAAQNLTGEQISRVMGIAGATARKWARRMGITLALRGVAEQLNRKQRSSRQVSRGAYTLWNDEQRARLRECEGMNHNSAAAYVGRSVKSVEHEAKRLGIRLRSRVEAARGVQPRLLSSIVPYPVSDERPVTVARRKAAAKKAPARRRRVVIETVSRIQYCQSCRAPVSDWSAHYERMPKCNPNNVTPRSAFPWLQPSSPARLAG